MARLYIIKDSTYLINHLTVLLNKSATTLPQPCPPSTMKKLINLNVWALKTPSPLVEPSPTMRTPCRRPFSTTETPPANFMQGGAEHSQVKVGIHCKCVAVLPGHPQVQHGEGGLQVGQGHQAGHHSARV